MAHDNISSDNKQTAETNKRVIHRWFEECINAGDLDLLNTLTADDHIGHGFGRDKTLTGRGELKDFLADYHAAFAELHYELEEVIAEDDTVATRYTASGIHEGEFATIEATGEEMTVPGMTAHRIEDGHVAETWVSFDTLDLLQQLGIL